jgi:hypothetical protein
MTAAPHPRFPLSAGGDALTIAKKSATQVKRKAM